MSGEMEGASLRREGLFPAIDHLAETLREEGVAGSALSTLHEIAAAERARNPLCKAFNLIVLAAIETQARERQTRYETRLAAYNAEAKAYDEKLASMPPLNRLLQGLFQSRPTEPGDPDRWVWSDDAALAHLPYRDFADALRALRDAKLVENSLPRGYEDYVVAYRVTELGLRMLQEREQPEFLPV